VLFRSPSASDGLGMLDVAAIKKVCEEAWPRVTNADELHEALLLLRTVTEDEARNLAPDSSGWLETFVSERRAGRLASPHPFWVPAERLAMIKTIYPGCSPEPPLVAPR